MKLMNERLRMSRVRGLALCREYEVCGGALLRTSGVMEAGTAGTRKKNTLCHASKRERADVCTGTL